MPKKFFHFLSKPSFLLPLLLFAMLISIHFILNSKYTTYKSLDMPETYSYYEREKEGISNSIYKALYYSVLNKDAKITFDPLTTRIKTEEIEKVIRVLAYDYPEFFYLDTSAPISYSASSITGHVFSVQFHYTLTDNELLKAKTVMQINKTKLMQMLSNKQSLKDNMQNIREWVLQSITYSDDTDYTHTAYGFYAMHLACCDGISRGVQVALRELGYSAELIKGTVEVNGKEEGHAWLYVSDSDGEEKYLADLTYALSHPSDTANWLVPATSGMRPAAASPLFDCYTPTL